MCYFPNIRVTVRFALFTFLSFLFSLFVVFYRIARDRRSEITVTHHKPLVDREGRAGVLF